MAEAVALSQATQDWLDVRQRARAKLLASLTGAGFVNFDPTPYRNETGGESGYPDTEQVTAELLDAMKSAGSDRGALTVEKEISLGQQVAILGAFKRDLTWRRSRKFHLLARYATHLAGDAAIQSIQVANIGATTFRRRERFT